MSTITTRAGKGSPLTHAEVDANFTNLNTDKLDTAGIAAGTAASPTIKFTGDPNTGLYSPGADQVAITTGGTGRLFVDASGRVGVGATPAGSIFEASNSGTASASDVVRIFNRTDGTSNGMLGLVKFGSTASVYGAYSANNVGVNSAFSQLNIGTETNHPLIAYTNNTERLRITSDGKVGIGTSSPTEALTIASGATDRVGASVSGTVATLFLGNSNNATSCSSISYDRADGGLRFNNGATGSITERARIDSSGRLLVGTSSSTVNTRLVVTGNSASSAGTGVMHLQYGSPTTNILNNYTIADLNYADSAGNVGAQIRAAADANWGASSFGTRLTFSTTADGASSPTERMRIGNNGNTYVGTTAAAYAAGERLSISPAASSNAVGIALGNTNNVGIGVYHGYTATGSATALEFQDHNAVVRGSITVTTSATAYNTSSDYRLKENIEPISGAFARVQALKPCSFNFISAPEKLVDGFIAHEAQAVVPECVTGEKDAVDDDGNPVYQGIDQSKLVPLLTAALQEAIAKIETLEAKVAALEGA